MKGIPKIRAVSYSKLSIRRNEETQEIEPVTVPSFIEPYTFRSIGFGFQLLDVEPRQDENCGGFISDGEGAITVFWSPGYGFKSKILIIETQVMGSLDILAEGSISSEEDEDLRWIENVINTHFEKWWDKGT